MSNIKISSEIHQSIRWDFPLFDSHKNLIYLDSTATTQKPAHVIDGVAEYLRTGYANIHRGSYELSEISEGLYEDSKKKVAQHIGAENWREIIYTSNSTYALNILAQSMRRTGILKKWDTVLVSIVEHHANIVPWLILKEDLGIHVEFISIQADFTLDIEDLKSKLTPNVRAISLAHVSNTTGQIFDLEQVGKILQQEYSQKNKPLFIVDASQSVPHFQVDVQKLGCDALFFTGHKVFADSGIGVLWAKEELLKTMIPIFSWGGAISCVDQEKFLPTQTLPDKFEPGTPNLTGAVSLLKAFEYIEHIWAYKQLEAIEKDLVEYSLEKFQEFTKKYSFFHLLWSTSSKNRVGVFTFYASGIHSHDIAEYLAEYDICIRAGQHCAEPAMKYFGVAHTCRMSLQIYNTREDIDQFFMILEKALLELA